MFHGAAVEVSGESSPATVVEMEEFGGYGFGVAVGWLVERGEDKASCGVFKGNEEETAMTATCESYVAE